MSKSIARKRFPADPAIVSYLTDSETDFVVEAYTVYEAYGLEVTTVQLGNGHKIVYEAVGGIGTVSYYNARGHCYMTVEE